MSDEGVDLSAFRSGFVVEADEHLATAGRNLIEVESDLKKGQPSPRAVRELYRSLHTIKGMAAMVGVEPIVEIAHGMESVLRAGDRAAGRLPERSLDLLARGIAAIENRVAAVASQGEVAAAPPGLLESLGELEPAPVLGPEGGEAGLVLPPELADKITAADRGQLDSVRPGHRVVRVDFSPSPARAAAGLNITAVRERVGALGEIVKVVPLSRARTDETPGGLVFALLVVTAAEDALLSEAAGGASVQALERQAAAPVEEDFQVEEVQPARGVVRVEVGRLDDALEKLSALVVTRSRMSRAVAELATRSVDVRALQQVTNELARQLRDLRASIMKARMVSAAQTFDRLPLLLRGLARTTGKAVGLELDTGSAELDKAVAERLFPAIIHLLRNAVDHAIEEPAAREKAGKPSRATIKVSCQPRANNQLEVVIEDDGRGIDVRGLAARARAEVPATEEGLLALLCTPGLSSLTQATTTSGRGMGMNIVRRVVVEELGGEMGVRTRAGQGTTFSLRIPLSITIMDAFTFRCGTQPFVVPVSAVEEIVEIDPALVTRAPSGKGRAELRMLERRGAAVPLVSLERFFRLEGAATQVRKAIVVKRNGQPFGFEVDQMLGQQEVVVRPLEDPLVKQPGIVGSTDLGDGLPTLVLDLVSLSGRVSRRRTDARP